VVEGTLVHLPVVVIDDGSTDDTAARAEAAGAGGVPPRLPASAAEPTLSVAVRVVAAVLAADRAPRSLAELATEHTGTAHGLDDGAPAAADAPQKDAQQARQFVTNN